MRVGINCGHTASGPGYGAVGLFPESQHTRIVGRAVMEKLRNAGVEVIDCTIDQANSSSEYLAAAIALGNRQDLDWFVSIHFNASASKEGHGVEVYTYEGRQYEDAVEVCNNIAALGFTNRGVKAGSGLYVIRKSKAKSMLIEVCFCDNQTDVNLYNSVGVDAIANAIFNGLYDYVVETPSQIPAHNENHNMSQSEFIEFVGRIGQRDWEERRLVLPSIVVAQALKESDSGKSELAQNANALFGVKQNGWTGKIYYKDATEQNPDGTYRKDYNTPWRMYNSWEESIIDHNTYIATRRIGNQTEPNFKRVIGELEYVRAAQYLQSAQFPYATAHGYAESLINDYIEKYNLTRFDYTEDVMAPEGTAFVVQVGAYRSKRNAEALARRLEAMGIITLVKQYKTQ